MRTAWALLAAAGVAILGFAYGFRHWGLAEASAYSVSYLGLVTGVLGLYCSIVGFTLAIHQIVKSRSSTEAAKAALDDVRAKLSTITASGEIEKARFALEEAERHILDSRPPKNIRHTISPARQCFVRLHELDLPLFADLKQQIEAVVKELYEIADTQDWDKDSIIKNAGLVRSYIDLTNRLQVRMNRG
jgi:hypothetical protein